MSEREKEMRLHRCCFTGHRPEKLTQPEEQIKRELEREILLAIADGFCTFITGMARGTDLWAGESVLKLRKEYPLHLICACPYPGFENRWKAEWQELYRQILSEADLVRYISKGYSGGCFRIRNEWMVSKSSRVIAVYNGSAGGTRNTILYAQKCGVEVRQIIG